MALPEFLLIEEVLGVFVSDFFPMLIKNLGILELFETPKASAWMMLS